MQYFGSTNELALSHIFQFLSEVESSRTSLASRTRFKVLGLEGQVLGLGLEASSPRKFPCPWFEDSTIFWTLKFFWKTPKASRKICVDLFCNSPSVIAWKKILNPFIYIFLRLFFLESTSACVLGPWPRAFLSLASSGSVLGKGCPWPWPRIFFCVLGLGLVSLTPPLIFMVINFEKSIFLCVFYVYHIKVCVLVSINSIWYINAKKMWVFADLDLFYEPALFKCVAKFFFANNFAIFHKKTRLIFAQNTRTS